MHEYLVDGGGEGDCSAWLSALVPRLEDVALSIASVMTREEKDQLKMFVTTMMNPLLVLIYSTHGLALETFCCARPGSFHGWAIPSAS